MPHCIVRNSPENSIFPFSNAPRGFKMGVWIVKMSATEKSSIYHYFSTTHARGMHFSGIVV